MEHAFLITAHGNWKQLIILLKQIDYPTHDIFIHIDAKAKDIPEKLILNSVKFSKIHIFTKYKVYWGGYSQTLAQTFLFKIDAKLGPYDYYHMMSGQGLLLVNNHKFGKFFEQNSGKEFIEFKDWQNEHDPEIKRRTKLYHFLQNCRRRYSRKYLNDIFIFMERCSLALQILLHINRVKN